MTSAPEYPLGPLDRVWIYRAQTLCFAGDELDFALLRSALEKLITISPILAGTLQPATTPGWDVIGAPYRDVDDILELAEQPELDYAAMRTRGFRPADFPRTLDPAPFIAPPPSPAMRVRVTRVRGGVIVAVFLHHALCDAAGSATILRKWAALCRGESVEPLEVDRAPFSLDKARGTGLLENHPEFVEQPASDGASIAGEGASEGAGAGIPTELPLHAHAMWYFSSANLDRLRQDQKAGNERLSANDLICAVFWKAFAVARRRRGFMQPNDVTRLHCAVDARGRIRPPAPEYVGNAVDQLTLDKPLADVLSASVVEAARWLHAVVARDATEDHVLDTLALLARYKDDMRPIGIAGGASLRGLWASSWARVDTYSLDWGRAFGEGKHLDRIRHPWNVFPGMIYPMPRGAYGADDQGIEVFVAMLDDEVQDFERDEVLAKYATRVY